MSSVVNKSKRSFIPNIKAKRQIKKPEASVLPTPPSTQIASIDPKDATVAPEDVGIGKGDDGKDDDDDAMESGNESDDMFQEAKTEFGDTLASNLHNTEFRKRRLSSITHATAPILLKGRSGSVSFVPTAAPPTKIGVPNAKPPRKRKSSVKAVDIRRARSRSIAIAPDAPLSTIAADSVAQPIALPTPSPNSGPGPTIEEEQPETQEPQVQKIDELAKDNLIGIDPETKKFRQYESLGPTGADFQFTSKVTSLSQIPRGEAARDLYLRQLTIDEECITMADLCKPFLPIGVVSEKFDLVKSAAIKIKQNREARKLQRAKARTEKKSVEEFEEERERKKEEDAKRKKIQKDLMSTKEPEESSYSSLQLNIKDGNIGIDETSTVVDRHLRDNHNEFKEREEQNPFENPVTSATYGKQRYTDRWSLEENVKFYNALSTWGTDFMVIAQLFPYRDRRQIKSKFNLEERKQPHLIELALLRKLPANLEDYCEESGKKLTSMEEHKEALSQMKRDHEDQLKKVKEEKEQNKKEDNEEHRRKELARATGTRTISRKQKLMEMRKNEEVLGSVEDMKRGKIE